MKQTEQTKAQHTPGAIRAAEAITGGKYGDGKRYGTSYGEKTVMGIADLIDRETAAPELCDFAVKASRSACLQQFNGDECYCFACEASRLLSKAKGGAL